MSVVQSIEEKGPWTKEVQIQVPADEVASEVSKIVNQFRRQVQMPGFRRGKAPASVVRKRFRADIDQEVIERLLPRYWEEAKSAENLDPLIAPQVQEVEVKDGEPLTFTATVEVRPEFDVDPSRDFELPSDEVLVGETEIDEVIERIQNDLGTFDTVERAAAHGDRVRINIRETPSDEEGDDAEAEATAETAEAADGGEAPEEDPWQEIAVELGDERVWEELTLALSGLEAGAKGDFTHQMPAPPVEEGEDPIAAPPPKHYQFEVLEVTEKKLADADDELAQKVSDFQTLDELRADIEKRIFEDKKQRQRSEREGKMIEQLIERHPLELPERVVEREVQSMLRDYAERLSRGGVDLETAAINWNEMSNEMKPQATSRVHAQIVLDAIAEADSIEVPDELLGNMVTQIARSQGKSLGEMQDELVRNGGLDMIKADLRRQRTVRHLLGEPLDEAPEHVHGPDCDHDHDHDHGHDHDHSHDDDATEAGEDASEDEATEKD